MKTIPAILGLAAGMVMLTGCWSPEAKARREQARVMIEQERVERIEAARQRIGQNPVLFAQLTPREQAIIRRGEIRIGFTPDMVQLALGRPDRISTSPLFPEIKTWIYKITVVPYVEQTPNLVALNTRKEDEHYPNMAVSATSASMQGEMTVTFGEDRVKHIDR